MEEPVSLAIKRLEIKHLYMHVETLQHFTPVQLSSILQHINPFIIGPFYKFIHTYRPMFPLRERQDFLPPRDAALHVLRDTGALTALVLPSGDAPSSALCR